MSQDPFQEREAEKYANPIPSREFIIEHLTKREKPANREELAVELNIEGEEQIEALRRRLRAMERDGQLVFTRRQCYALPERLDLLKGIVIGHRDGFGFLRVEGRKDDLYLSSEQMKMCIHGDQILAQLNKLFAPYGVGRGVYTGDTVIGLKGRIVFEAPGLVSLLAAHRALEDAVLTKQQNRFKPDVARKWVELVYEGFYHDPLKTDIEAFLKSSQAKVNGEVVLETRGGRVDAVAVKSPHLLNTKGATYAQSADWGVEEAEGFIKLFGMSSTVYAQVNRG